MSFSSQIWRYNFRLSFLYKPNFIWFQRLDQTMIVYYIEMNIRYEYRGRDVYDYDEMFYSQVDYIRLRRSSDESCPFLNNLWTENQIHFNYLFKYNQQTLFDNFFATFFVSSSKGIRRSVNCFFMNELFTYWCFCCSFQWTCSSVIINILYWIRLHLYLVEFR